MLTKCPITLTGPVVGYKTNGMVDTGQMNKKPQVFKKDLEANYEFKTILAVILEGRSDFRKMVKRDQLKC